MRETGPVLGLEQKCVKPGHWLIEGFDVRKSPLMRGHPWLVMDGDELVVSCATLREAREAIRGRLD